MESERERERARGTGPGDGSSSVVSQNRESNHCNYQQLHLNAHSLTLMMEFILMPLPSVPMEDSGAMQSNWTKCHLSAPSVWC